MFIFVDMFCVFQLVFEMASPTVVFRYAEDTAGPGKMLLLFYLCTNIYIGTKKNPLYYTTILWPLKKGL